MQVYIPVSYRRERTTFWPDGNIIVDRLMISTRMVVGIVADHRRHIPSFDRDRQGGTRAGSFLRHCRPGPDTVARGRVVFKSRPFAGAVVRSNS